MKHLKIYEKFESYINKSEIDKFCLEYNIKNYKINEDGSVDVNESVFLPAPLMKSVAKIPIKFNVVKGDFHCNYTNIVTLENSPVDVRGNFYVNLNKLRTLLGGPKYTHGYYCFKNDLRDVYGFPLKLDAFGFNYNPVCEILELSYSTSNNIISREKLIKFIELLNEFTVIRNQDTVISDRLKVALEYIGIDFDSIISLGHDFEFKNYKVI